MAIAAGLDLKSSESFCGVRFAVGSFGDEGTLAVLVHDDAQVGLALGFKEPMAMAIGLPSRGINVGNSKWPLFYRIE